MLTVGTVLAGSTREPNTTKKIITFSVRSVTDLSLVCERCIRLKWTSAMVQVHGI